MIPTLERPLCFLDIESATRGPYPDPSVDKIVHLCMYWIRPAHHDTTITMKFNPGFLMSDNNIECHRITNEMAKAYPALSEANAKGIAMGIAGCDIAGFNHSNYDIPLLWEECFRVGVELNMEGVNLIDVGTIMKKKEERSLEAAVRFYCGRGHIGAHDCENDVKETIEVFKAQLDRYGDLAKMSMPELASFARHDERVDLAGKIIKGPDGEPVYGFGPRRGLRVLDDRGFAYWMLNKDFPEYTKRVLRKILEEGAQQESQQGLF